MPNKTWTKNEERLLLQHYPKIGAVGVAKKLKKTESSVRHKAARSEVKYKRDDAWTKKEVEVLKNEYSEKGSIVMAEELGRSRSSIKHKASRLGLNYNQNIKWTNKEIALLKKYYPTEGAEYVARLVKKDVWNLEKHIIQKAYLLGVKADKKLWYRRRGKKILEKSQRGEINHRRGKDHYRWVEDRQEKYGEGFDNRRKEKIRKRDKNRCLGCRLKWKEGMRKFDVHHIDYNKDNHKDNNLITLCKSCHMKTNNDREKWEKHYKKIIRIAYS